MEYYFKELMQRYKLSSPQALRNRLDAVGIKLHHDERQHTYADEAQVEILDSLHKHLSIKGSTLKSFIPISKVEVYSLEKESIGSDNSKDNHALYEQESVETSSQIIDSYRQIVDDLLGTIVSSLPEPDTLNYHEKLEKISANKWTLTTSELKSIIGIRPQGKDYFIRGCWKFKRSGKIGNSSGWIVIKIDIE